MSERTHSNATKNNTPWMKIFGGTVIAIAGAAVLFQVFQQKPAAAPTGEQAGNVNLNSSAPTLARINGKLVGYDVVARECFDRIGSEVLENIINRMIIQQEMTQKNLIVSEAELNQEVVKIAKRFNLPVDTWYQMLQSERDLTPLQYRRDVIWPMLALRKLAGEKVQISESDMRRAFERDYGPRVRVRMIMMNNVRRANQVWELATKTPDEFDRLARENSIEPSSRALGGAIPPISRYSGNQSLEDTAFRLKPGEVSGLVQVGSKYVILKCEGHTKQVVTDIKDVHEQLYDQLVEVKTQERIAQVFDSLKKKTRVDNYLANTSTGGRKATAQSSSNYTNQIQQTGTTLPGSQPKQNQNPVRQTGATQRTTN